jgi:large subunit ribosomal protein L9
MPRAISEELIMGLVQVILNEDIHALGEAGEIVSVKPGYARNFLVAQGKAVLATAERVHQVEHQQRVISEKRAKEFNDLESVKTKLDAVKLEIEAQAGEEGKLFGSVTAQNLAELLAEKGLDIDRRKIVLPEAIKSLGEHRVKIRLRGDIVAEFEVTVTAAS